MAGKTKRHRAMAEEHRQKIKVAALMNFLQEHSLDDREASPTRIDAAKFLLNKAISNPAQDSNLNVSGDMALSGTITFVSPSKD